MQEINEIAMAPPMQDDKIVLRKSKAVWENLTLIITSDDQVGKFRISLLQPSFTVLLTTSLIFPWSTL